MIKKILRNIKKFSLYCFHMVTRHYDFPTECRMEKIGSPDENAPIFLSGNYTYTVDWLKNVLSKAKIDCYLLIADSSGSNVWCAAGMNEFTEHDIIDAIKVAGLDKKVKHRKIITPPYAAPGVDKKAVNRETGFDIIWGPTHLRDIPAYVKNDFKRTYEMHIVNNDLRDRIEPAMSNAMAYLLSLLVLLVFNPKLILGVIIIFFTVNLFFHGLLPVLPKEINFKRTFFGITLLTMVLSSIAWLGRWELNTYFLWELILLLSIFLVVTDMCGSTNIYKTTIFHWLKNGNYESHFNPVINPMECVGCVECMKVCPKGVYALSLSTKKVVAVNPKECMECLACVKQCSQKAIYNKKGGKLKNDVKSIPNLTELMQRNTDFLTREAYWINAMTEIRGELKVIPKHVNYHADFTEKAYMPEKYDSF